MRPLLYGYVRTDLANGRAAEMDDAIDLFARREGFDLGAVFHEGAADWAAFSELVSELRRADARHVAVPAAEHLAGGVGLSRHVLLGRLWNEAHAGVWVARGLGDEEVRLVASASAAPMARLHIRHALSRWQLPELMAPVERAVEELVADMLRHRPHPRSRSDPAEVVVRLRRTEQVQLEVWDAAADIPTALPHPADRRVAALSRRSGREHPDAGGAVAWAEFPVGKHVG